MDNSSPAACKAETALIRYLPNLFGRTALANKSIPTQPAKLHAIMLVMTRKVGERIVIGDNVTITVVRIAGGMVRIGIDAPPEYTVVRRELTGDSAVVTESSPASQEE